MIECRSFLLSTDSQSSACRRLEETGTRRAPPTRPVPSTRRPRRPLPMAAGAAAEGEGPTRPPRTTWPMMPRECGAPTSNRASRRPWPSTPHVVDERLFSPTRERCMVSVNLLISDYDKTQQGAHAGLFFFIRS